MPKIRFVSLPREVWQHILNRVNERRISFAAPDLLNGPYARDVTDLAWLRIPLINVDRSYGSPG